MKSLAASYLMLAIAVAGCSSPAPSKRNAEAKLRKQIVGKWWSDDPWLGQPFSSITFNEDGSFTRTNANIANMAMSHGAWRLNNHGIIFTVQPDTVPPGTEFIFQVLDVTHHNMTLTNLFDKTCSHFKR